MMSRMWAAGLLTTVPPLAVVTFFVLTFLSSLGIGPDSLVPLIWVVPPSVGVLAALMALALSLVELSYRFHAGALVMALGALVEVVSIIVIWRWIVDRMTRCLLPAISALS